LARSRIGGERAPMKNSWHNMQFTCVDLDQTPPALFSLEFYVLSMEIMLEKIRW